MNAIIAILVSISTSMGIPPQSWMPDYPINEGAVQEAAGHAQSNNTNEPPTKRIYNGI